MSTDPIPPYVLQYHNAIFKLLEKLYSKIELMKYLVYDALNKNVLYLKVHIPNDKVVKSTLMFILSEYLRGQNSPTWGPTEFYEAKLKIQV